MAISNNTTGVRPGVCTSTTRPTAPYEGQVIYETDTDLSYIWNGSAWQQVSGGTAVGNSGLVYIKSQEIGTAVSSVVVSDVFSSLYDDYKILVQGGVGSVGGSFNLTIGSAVTAYQSSVVSASYTTSTVASIPGGNTFINLAGNYDTTRMHMNMEVSNPFRPTRTVFWGACIQGSTSGSVGGNLRDNNSYTYFTLTASSGTFTGGTITVYGYRKA